MASLFSLTCVCLEKFSNCILLGSYYKYGTYKCYRPDFWDCTVCIFENLWKIFSFSIFQPIENKTNDGIYKWKLLKKPQTVCVRGLSQITFAVGVGR